MNLKPVWFYQEGLAGGTSAALYDAGSLVIWWLGIPAIAFVSWMAFKRRSLALTLIAVGFAAQWIPWARIDRAAFQYHYYTALPFVVLALAYFVAEFWHGASRHAWALARRGGGRDRRAGADVAASPAAVRVRRRRIGQPGVAGLPGGHPGVRPDARGRPALAMVLGVGLVSSSARFLAFQATTGGRPGAAS